MVLEGKESINCWSGGKNVEIKAIIKPINKREGSAIRHGFISLILGFIVQD